MSNSTKNHNLKSNNNVVTGHNPVSEEVINLYLVQELVTIDTAEEIKISVDVAQKIENIDVEEQVVVSQVNIEEEEDYTSPYIDNIHAAAAYRSNSIWNKTYRSEKKKCK